MIKELDISKIDNIMKIWIEENTNDHDFISKDYWETNYDYVRNVLPDATVFINCIYYSWKYIYVDVLWVKEEYRNTKIGSQLLNEIEETAKEYDCHIVHLDTFDFQAKDFYIKHGYEIHGVLDDCPQGHKRYYMKKII